MRSALPGCQVARRPAPGRLRGALLAALACAAALAFPAAADAQREVWSATLTPRTIAGTLIGCLQGFAGALCTDTNNLSGYQLEYGGNEYLVSGFYVDTSTGTLSFLGTRSFASDTDLLVLVVGDSSFRFADASPTDVNRREWSDTGLSWTVGTDVSVSLIVPEHLAACDGDTAPAGAFWTSCLTVGEITSGTLYGYDVAEAGSLDDATFSREGTDHEIYAITSTSTALNLTFETAQASSASGWTLQVGSTSYALSAATYNAAAFRYTWTISTASGPAPMSMTRSPSACGRTSRGCRRA